MLSCAKEVQRALADVVNGTQLALLVTMIPPSVMSFKPSNERQISGRSNLNARCATCGAVASDWRHLLGVGASITACSVETQGALLTYPGGCGRCGASKLLVDVSGG
jgi:hypothetical protein